MPPDRMAAGPDARDVETDVTSLPGMLADEFDTSGHEGADKVIDGSRFTKYFTPHPTTWLRYSLDAPATIRRYTVRSANDAPDRDPRSWALDASSDGTTWHTLDRRTDEAFTERFEEHSYDVANDNAYRHYRLRITANDGSPHTQLAQWRLFAPGDAGGTPIPAAPADLAIDPVSDNQIVITWRNGDRWASGYRLERSANDGAWYPSGLLPAGTTRHVDAGLRPSTTYAYRIRAENAAGVSGYSRAVGATTGNGGLPATWRENWPGHDQILTRVYYDDDVAIYFDRDVDRRQTWLAGCVGRVWRYTKRTYGDFSDPRLAAIFHQGRYGGGHPAVYFDEHHGYRNATDIGLDNWSAADPQTRDLITHEVGHIVEGASCGVHGSPSFSLWGDSKWCEIFQYDVYVGTGMTDDARRWYAAKLGARDNFPRANTAWFRDWFYPIWLRHGRGQVLAAYFQLLADHFLTFNGRYARDLNWGEFVHFWSGAAGVNLQSQAATAFGWPQTWQRQFERARADFAEVRYANR